MTTTQVVLRAVGTWSAEQQQAPGPRSADLADADLVRRVAEGDAQAFESLMTRYQSPIHGFLRGMLGNREDAQDAAQEVFVRVFTQAHRYQPSAPFRSWLYRIATNVAIDAVRKRKRRWFGLLPARTLTTHDGDERNPLDEVPSGGATALALLIDDERDQHVARAVATLPRVYRAALVLRDLQDLSYEEVAVVLGCRVGTVKSRINRARNLLRDKLSPRDGESS
jgi:RNA polymerase sigma-70 factor (ECF subfamily)